MCKENYASHTAFRGFCSMSFIYSKQMGGYTTHIKCLRLKCMLMKNDSRDKDVCFIHFKSHRVLITIHFFTAKMSS